MTSHVQSLHYRCFTIPRWVPHAIGLPRSGVPLRIPFDYSNSSQHWLIDNTLYCPSASHTGPAHGQQQQPTAGRNRPGNLKTDLYLNRPVSHLLFLASGSIFWCWCASRASVTSCFVRLTVRIRFIEDHVLSVAYTQRSSPHSSVKICSLLNRSVRFPAIPSLNRLTIASLSTLYSSHLTDLRSCLILHQTLRILFCTFVDYYIVKLLLCL